MAVARFRLVYCDEGELVIRRLEERMEDVVHLQHKQTGMFMWIYSIFARLLPLNSSNQHILTSDNLNKN